MKAVVGTSVRTLASMLAVALLFVLIYATDTNASAPIQDGADAVAVK